MPEFFPGEPKNWKHHIVAVRPNPLVRLHYVEVLPKVADPAKTPIILIHGYPQTWYAWRHIMQPLADRGHRVIAVDYRGAGSSSRPVTGYDKKTMAEDIHILFHDILKVDKPVIVGHDIGSMVVVSLALHWGGDIGGLIAFEAPLPGTSGYESVIKDPSTAYNSVFHFFFHNYPDIPELLTQGRERIWLTHFFHRLCYNPAFANVQDVDLYVRAFEQAGAMRAGFDLYRSFQQDVSDTSKALERGGKYTGPTLALVGKESGFLDITEAETKEIASNVTFQSIANSGHWIAEENPDELLSVMSDFIDTIQK